MLGDGIVTLEVTAKNDAELLTRVVAGGVVRSRQGLNLPDTELTIGSVTDKDWQDMALGVELGVDALALSFVQGPDDLLAVRRFLADTDPMPQLIAKIELPIAGQRIDAILDEADGIMVARGDLGITLPIEHVPVVQKRLIQTARRRGKFTITATQMLESMIHNQRPTRADASDVANAVFDGTDCVMLSGETAIGDHPDQVIRTMAEILRHSEPYGHFPPLPSGDDTIDSAMARAVKDLVDDLKARAVIVPITNGSTVVRVSRQRGPVPIVAGLRDEFDARRLNFFTAVFPKPSSSPDNLREALEALIDRACGQGWLQAGDVVVVAGGYPLERTGVTNFIRAHVVGEEL
jgi:pyruvate kinase